MLLHGRLSYASLNSNHRYAFPGCLAFVMDWRRNERGVRYCFPWSVQDALNDRPHRVLGFRNSREVFGEVLAASRPEPGAEAGPDPG